MIHIMLPTQYSSRTGVRLAEPHNRLMAAVGLDAGGLREEVDVMRAPA